MNAWYVVQTKPRKESLAETHLRRQGFETYLPWYKHVAKQRCGWKEAIEPLFPRYLFLRLDPTKQTVAPIRSTRGVTTLVTFGHRLVPVPDSIIAMLRDNADVHTGLQRAPDQQLEAGQTVSITAGPFEGLQGVFQAVSGEARVTILLDVLGKATRVVMARANIAAA
jgi:transcriptional antiterminator RfaH